MPKRERRRPLEDRMPLCLKIFGGVSLLVIFLGVATIAFDPIGVIDFFRFYFGDGKPTFGTRRPNPVKPEESPSAQTRFSITFNNGKTIRVRLALTEIERMRGLMGCRELGENEGMLFVYPTSEARAFWMKNVPIDLDIGYFDAAGTLLEVYAMRAHNTNSVYSKSNDVRFCLEMNRAWFEKNRMLPSDNVSLDLNSLRQALRERGFEL